MKNTTVPDFATPVNRESTDAAKYDLRKRVFNNSAVQPLWVADMDLGAPPFLQEALQERIAHPCFGYTVQSKKLKQAVQWWMQHEHNLAVEPAAIHFSPSVVTTISNTLCALTKKEDGVALFSPVYERFYSAITHQQRTVVNIPLLLNNVRYEIDFTSFQQACQSGQVRLLLFCNPQNPSGRVWHKDELARLVALCNKYDVLLFSDEIHSDIIFAPHVHTSIQTIPGAENNTIIAHSTGKTFNTSGLQGSFALIPNPRQRKLFRAETKRTHTTDINLLAKTAIETLLSENGQEYKHQLIAYLSKNRTLLKKQISDINSLSLMCPESTFLAWIDFQKTGLTHDEIIKKLTFEAGLGLGTGLAYGAAGDKWFRLNFAVSSDMLQQALEKLSATFL